MKSNLLIAAVALLLASCGNKGNMKMGDNEYPVVTIGSQNAELQTTYPATIKGVQDVQIRPKVSGFITKVCVQEGQAAERAACAPAAALRRLDGGYGRSP